MHEPTLPVRRPSVVEDESADPVGDGHSDADFAQRNAGAGGKEPTPSVSAPSTQDAVALVHEDHQRISAALLALHQALAAGASNADRQGLLSRLALRLRAHGTVESELLYPLMYPTEQAHHNEHEQFEEALQDMSQATTTVQEQQERATVLAQRVKSHFEREERDLVAFVALHTTDLLELGTRMALRRGELLADESSD
jgi:hemerythrin